MKEQQLQTILVVDDEKDITELLRDFLEHEGYEVKMASTASEAMQIIHQLPIHCMILDIMMPGMSGFELCRQIRESSQLPILFLSARGEDVDKIRGLSIGGDDYIVKTASPGEIVARGKAVLRRAVALEPSIRNSLHCGHLTLDLSTREVFVEGQQVTFTPKEYELLRWFVEHPDQVCKSEATPLVLRLLLQSFHHVNDVHAHQLSRLLRLTIGDSSSDQHMISGSFLIHPR